MPMATGLWLAALGAATAAATLAGGLVTLRVRSGGHLILGFSAGAVLGVALLDLLPEALVLTGDDRRQVAGLMVMGFLAYLAMSRGLRGLVSDTGRSQGVLGPASLVAHSVLDGLGIGLGFQASPAVGSVLAAAVLAHDFADGVNTVTLSLSASSDRRMAWTWLAADALAPLAGIVLSRLVHPSAAALGALLSIFSGVFLYLGAVELIPESHSRHPRASVTMATLVGLAVIGLAVRFAER